MNLKEILQYTITKQYAVGSFSARCSAYVKPILMAAQKTNSPAIVQISQKELGLYQVTPKKIADVFYKYVADLGITVPVVLHLDHTREIPVIVEAIEAGFQSVMIDASEKEYSENVRLTKQVVDFAHSKGVSVEAEIGKIGANDLIETDQDCQLFTVPEEALSFCRETSVDALAVSVGTAHGVYLVKKPEIQYDLIQSIHKLTPTYLVLHGGSGVPSDLMIRSYQLEGGGISKVNYATDLELAFLEGAGLNQRITDAECDALPSDILNKGLDAVLHTVSNKIQQYLLSENKAW